MTTQRHTDEVETNKATDTVEGIVATITADIAAVGAAHNVETYGKRVAAMDLSAEKATLALSTPKLFALLGSMSVADDAAVLIMGTPNVRNAAHACFRSALQPLLAPTMDEYRLSALANDFVWVLDHALIAAEAILRNSLLVSPGDIGDARTGIEELRIGHGDGRTVRNALKAASLLDDFLINSSVSEQRALSVNHGFTLCDIRERADHARLVETAAQGGPSFEERLVSRLAPNGSRPDRHVGAG